MYCAVWISIHTLQIIFVRLRYANRTYATKYFKYYFAKLVCLNCSNKHTAALAATFNDSIAGS